MRFRMISTERSRSLFWSLRFGGGTACITTSRPPWRSRPSVASLWIGDDGTIIATIAAIAAPIRPSRIRYFRRSLTGRAKISARSRPRLDPRPPTWGSCACRRSGAAPPPPSLGGARRLGRRSFGGVDRLRLGRRAGLVADVLFFHDAGDRVARGADDESVRDLDLQDLAVDLRDHSVEAAGGDDLVPGLEARNQLLLLARPRPLGADEHEPEDDEEKGDDEQAVHAISRADASRSSVSVLYARKRPARIASRAPVVMSTRNCRLCTLSSRSP